VRRETDRQDARLDEEVTWRVATKRVSTYGKLLPLLVIHLSSLAVAGKDARGGDRVSARRRRLEMAEPGWAQVARSKDAKGHLFTLWPVGIPQSAARVGAKPPPKSLRRVRPCERGRLPEECQGEQSADVLGERRSRHSSPRLGKPATRRRAAVCRTFGAQITGCDPEASP
jgi:hypothetical protein